jgi:hypothetical protein
VITLALLAGYAITLAFVLHLLTASRRGEEVPARPPSPPPPPRFEGPRIVARPDAARTLVAHPDLGRLAATVHDTLEVERVAVVVSDADEPGTGVVAACFGVPGLLGNRVPVLDEPATGLLYASDVAALGIGDGDGEPDEEPWAVAQLPITGRNQLLGALTVASRREREFSDYDLRVLERLAREGAPQFDRRRRAQVPKAIA